MRRRRSSSYDGVTVARVLAALDAYRARAEPPPDLLEACRARDLPQALAAIDIALLDIAGQHAGLPVSASSDRHAPRSVEVNASIGAPSPGRQRTRRPRRRGRVLARSS